jgi:membrane-associated phospholipid phosphatase
VKLGSRFSALRNVYDIAYVFEISEWICLSKGSGMPENQINKEMQNVVESAQQEVSAARRPWYHVGRVTRILLIVYAVQLILFAALAWWVHFNPIIPLDVKITREFQENPTPWLSITMSIVSYPGSSLLQEVLIALAALIFWLVGLRLEAVFIVALSAVSAALNVLIKFVVARPRPTARLVDVFQVVNGQSFPSGHVMAYLALWGLLFSFGIILFRGTRWWRILLLVISGLFVVLVGPSRIYLGAHWASDVLGSYLIGGVLLGITLWLYLQLKRRGVLESRAAGDGAEGSKVFRSFSPR